MLKEAVFAARIQSIGRFTGENAAGFVNKYGPLLGRYLDAEALTHILEGSEGFEEEHRLAVRAAALAGSETDMTQGRLSRGKNLASVFSRLSMNDGQRDRSEFYRYTFSKLTPETAFPAREPVAEEKDKEKLVQGFYEAMDELSASPPEDYHGFITCFDRISLQYLWCITASDYEGEDISLYDFMKVSEAIMACLVQSKDQEAPFTMVSGDFSGIQKYIFGISSANQTGVAKRLRARSFYVDIVSRVFSQYVIDCFGVERANILLQTGGKFYCLVPTMEDMDGKMEAVRQKFDEHLYDTFHGAVSVNLAWLPCTDEDIRQYSDTVVRLNDRLGESKNSPFGRIIKGRQGWNREAFILCDDLKNKHICKGCGSEFIPSSEESCPMCRMQTEIGGRLPRASYIVYMKDGGEGSYPIFDGYSIKLIGKADRAAFQGAFLIEALNRAEIPESCMGLPVIRKYMANHIPVKGYETKTFSEIADQGTGVSRMGVLKADVDVLGFLFAQGLRTKERHFGTISRVNTMSRMLEVFFSGYVEELLENHKQYQDVYSVFSGGDDLFLIGPWDMMFSLAIDIRKEFRRFSAENDCVTMSAAVCVFGSKEHIANMAEHSEEELDRAKNELLPEIYPERTGRNAVCAMGQVFSWEDFEEQTTVADRLRRMVSGNRIGIGILRRISEYSSMYRQFLADKDVWKLMFEPLFYYDRQRNYRFNKNDPDCAWFIDEYVKSMDNAADYRTVRKNLYFAETTVKIALNKTRKERN